MSLKIYNPQPQFIIIGGPNGAGTSITSENILEPFGIKAFDWDKEFDLKWKLFDSDPSVVEGIREATNSDFNTHIEAAFSENRSVSYETNFHSSHNFELAKKARQNGFYNRLYFLAITDPELALERVKLRVRKGGQNDVFQSFLVFLVFLTKNTKLIAIENLQKIILVILCLVSSEVSYSQDCIIGRVLDERTYEPVNKVFIEIEGSETKTYSNYAGYFQIEADAGTFLSFKCPGYFEGRIEIPEEKRFQVLLSPSRLDTAEYIGGNARFLQNMGKNLKYPSNAMRNKIEGELLFSFGVDSLGKIVNPHFLNFVSKEMNKEVLQAFNKVPVTWIPADSQTNFILPIKFVMGANDKNFERTDNLDGFFVLSEIVVVGYGMLPYKHDDTR